MPISRFVLDDGRPLSGGCQCGAVRYEIHAEPMQLYICHCTECRRQSASAFGVSLIAPADALRIVAGAPKLFTRPTSHAAPMRCYFCGDCGSRIYHANDAWGNEVSVKGGTLDQRLDLAAATHIWTASAAPGVEIPREARRIAGEPG